MKVEVQSKKGLRTCLSIVVDKKIIQLKIQERLSELQKEIALKGFRPGKVPPSVIKSQFGKSIYGEVIDKILRETSTKAISEKKLKVAGQPKIDLKQFGEGKDLDYTIEMDILPIKTGARIKKIKRANPHAKIIVERIETHAQFHSLKQAGCDLFQGYFFSRPEMITYKDVEPGKVIVFDLLRFTAKESLCFDEIQRQVARDVAITARVLKLANARSGSTKLTITSISQAVVYLGEDSIRQLVRVLALSELGADKPTELTKLALTRAQFIALLLGQNHAELVGQGYLVGLFSVMDAILDTDLEAIVKEFSLDESIAQALLNNEGILGQSLALIRAFELDEMDKIAVLMPAINSDLHIGHIFNYVLDALLYSDEIIEAIAE